MKKEMSSVVSQVPGLSGESQGDHFLSHQHLGFLSLMTSSGPVPVEVLTACCVCLMCVAGQNQSLFSDYLPCLNSFIVKCV